MGARGGGSPDESDASLEAAVGVKHLGGGDGSGAGVSWKDEEPVGGRTEEEAVDSDGAVAAGVGAPALAPVWPRRHREAMTLQVPSEVCLAPLCSRAGICTAARLACFCRLQLVS